MKIKKSGLLLILVAIVLTSCKKKNESPDYYFKGAINGTAVNWEVTDTSDWLVTTGISRMESNLGIAYAMIELKSNHASVDVGPGFNVGFGTYDVINNEVSASNFNDFITIGTWAYAPKDVPVKGIKDITISYTTPEDILYTSAGLQTGSTFDVISVTQLGANNSNASLKIKITFNCKLYPYYGGGQPLMLTNGEAVLYMENMF